LVLLLLSEYLNRQRNTYRYLMTLSPLTLCRPAGGICLILAICIGCRPEPKYEQITLSIEAVCDLSFGHIGGIRELSDRRLIVADPLGVALVLADLDLSSVDSIGRIGSGPDEYRQPDRVLLLPGDSTLLVDLGNARLSVIDPRARFTEQHPIARLTASGTPMLIVPRFTDEVGRLYFLAEGAGGRRTLTAAVARFDRTTLEVDTLATVALPDRSKPPPPGTAGPSIPPDLFAPRDDWAVAGDGSVAIVTGGNYAVRWILAAGDTVSGPVIDYTEVRVDGEDREELLGELLPTLLTMQSGGESAGIAMGRGLGLAGHRAIDLVAWPEVLPAFRPERAIVTPGGLLWVERYTLPGDAPQLDVFDRSGRKRAEVRLPLGRRVVGFGSEAVYLARVDDDGLEWLERYTLPTGA